MQSSLATFFTKRSLSLDNESASVNISASSSGNDPPLKRSKKVAHDLDVDEIAWEYETIVSESESESENELSDHQPQTSAASQLSKSLHISQALSKLSGPSDISNGKTDSPSQPELASFPSHQIGNRLRSFKLSWFTNRKWLEYSVLEDAAYCFCCRHFPQPGKVPEAAFVSTGYRQWKKAKERDSGFAKHEKSDFHKYAFCSWQDFQKLLEQDKTIEKSLSSAHEKLVSDNKHYIMEIAKVLCLTARQKIAQRGHGEGPTSVNKGNCLEILQLISDKDQIVKDHLSKQRAKYTSPLIQNEIIDIMGQMILTEISSEVNKSHWFSIMADESKDISGKEQLSVVVRYLYQNNIHEEFLGFIHLYELNAQGLKTNICDILQKCNIDLNNCVGQTYDGASVMRGQNAGVQTLIRNDVPQATYIHCYNHRLNLVIVEAVKSVKLADQFFELLEQMYVFMSSSVVHEIFIKKQAEMVPGQQPRKLKKLSETRWSCQYAVCKVMLQTASVVIATLEDISNEYRGKRALDASSLLNAIDFSFLLNVSMFSDLLYRTKLLSDMLQSPSLNLAAAADMVETVQEDLAKQRNQDDWDSIWDVAENLAKEVEIPLEISKPKRKKQVSHRVQGSVVMETLGQREDSEEMTTKQSLRISLYYPVLDKLLSELDHRFSQDNIQLLRSIATLDPCSSKFMNLQLIQPMAVQYNVELDDLDVEICQARRLVMRKKSEGVVIDSVAKLQVFMEPYKDAFPALCKLLEIALILPPTSASCERSFSCMRMIKSYLRNSMADTRLSALSVLGIHAGRAQCLNMDLVVSTFAKQHNNRNIVLF